MMLGSLSWRKTQFAVIRLALRRLATRPALSATITTSSAHPGDGDGETNPTARRDATGNFADHSFGGLPL